VRRAIVIGAGPGGLCTALALRQAGYTPVVCEAMPEMREVGSGLTLWPNALTALELLGVGTIRDGVAPLRGIAMKRHTGAPIFFVPCEGAIGWAAALHRAELQAKLVAAVGGSALLLAARCVKVTQDASSVTACFAGGATLSGELLIGADGLHSRVRSAVAGDDALRWSGYRVWRGVAALELNDGIGVTSLGRGAQFGIFPMSGGRTYWFAAVSEPEAEPPGRVAREFLLERFADWHAPAADLIGATDGASIVASAIHDRRPIARWVSGRIALLGDAAHPSEPTLGQGACQAIEDAATLGACLAAEPSVPAALLRYQAHRIARANSLTHAARRIGRIGQWRNPIACRFRDWLLAITPDSLRRRQFHDLFTYSPPDLSPEER